MIVLAIDPGYERLGIAVIEKLGGEKEKLLYSDCFRTPAKNIFEARLLSIGKEVERLILEYGPTGLAIENLFLSNNQKTAMRVAEVRGSILYIASKLGLSIKEMTPLQIKLAVTGDGNSKKDQVIRMVHLLAKIPEKKMLDDEYDAIAVGLAYFALHKNL